MKASLGMVDATATAYDLQSQVLWFTAGVPGPNAPGLFPEDQIWTLSGRIDSVLNRKAPIHYGGDDPDVVLYRICVALGESDTPRLAQVRRAIARLVERFPVSDHYGEPGKTLTYYAYLLSLVGSLRISAVEPQLVNMASVGAGQFIGVHEDGEDLHLRLLKAMVHAGILSDAAYGVCKRDVGKARYTEVCYRALWRKHPIEAFECLPDILLAQASSGRELSAIRLRMLLNEVQSELPFTSVSQKTRFRNGLSNDVGVRLHAAFGGLTAELVDFVASWLYSCLGLEDRIWEVVSGVDSDGDPAMKEILEFTTPSGKSYLAVSGARVGEEQRRRTFQADLLRLAEKKGNGRLEYVLG